MLIYYVFIHTSHCRFIRPVEKKVEKVSIDDSLFMERRCVSWLGYDVFFFFLYVKLQGYPKYGSIGHPVWTSLPTLPLIFSRVLCDQLFLLAVSANIHIYTCTRSQTYTYTSFIVSHFAIAVAFIYIERLDVFLVQSFNKVTIEKISLT